MSGNQTSLLKRVLGLPQSFAGRFAVILCIVFFVLFGAWLGYLELRPIQRPTFFSDPLHAAILLTAAGSAIFGAFIAVFAIVMRGERSVFTLLSVLGGSFVLFWTVAELIGH